MSPEVLYLDIQRFLLELYMKKTQIFKAFFQANDKTTDVGRFVKIFEFEPYLCIRADV